MSKSSAPTTVSMSYSPEGNVSLSSKSGTTFWFSGDSARNTVRVPAGVTAVITVRGRKAEARVL